MSTNLRRERPMSTNCIYCGVNKRTSFDLLCGPCRDARRPLAEEISFLKSEIETLKQATHEVEKHAKDLQKQLEAAEALVRERKRTPDATLPPLGDGPRRKMLIEIEVTEDFERRLDNQWMVEREIHADRWSWHWAYETTNAAEVK